MLLETEAIARWIGMRLLTGSLEGAAVIVLVWFASRRMPRLPAGWLAALWWLAAAKVLGAFVLVAGLSIPLLPANAPVMAGWSQLAPAAIDTRHTDTAAAWAAAPPASVTNGQAHRRAIGTAILAAVGVWFLGLGVHGFRLARTVRRVRALVRGSVPAPEEAEIVTRLAAVLGLRHAPEVRASSVIETPQLVGVRRPIVLVPADRSLSSDDRAMALCHELVHVRRRDLVLGCVPALAERLFFFHPLVRLAAREYVTARESACDATVVRTLGVSPATYGRLLLRIGIAQEQTALAAGGASSSTSSLRRRLEMLQHVGDAAMSRGLICSLAIVLVVAMTPFRIVAKTSSGNGEMATAALTRGSGVDSTATPGQISESAPSSPGQRSRGTVEIAESPSPRQAGPLEPGVNAARNTTRSTAIPEQRSIERRRQELEMMRQALDEQLQREQSLLSRDTITRERVAERKREYLAALQAFQEAQERRMRLAIVHQQLAQLTGEQQALSRRLQDQRVAAKPQRYSRGDVVTLTPAPDGTRPPDSRVLAIPGDDIRVERAGIFVNGTPATEVSRDFLAGLPEETWQQSVPPDHYFVAAEERVETGVTRFWGLIPGTRISGRR